MSPKHSQKNKIYWYATNDEYKDYEANVIRCVRNGDDINITFSSIEEGDLIEGRLTLKSTVGEQTTVGYWRYPAQRVELQRFTEYPDEREDVEIEASVTGHLEKVERHRVIFMGIWSEVGAETAYELDIEAEIR